MRLAAAQCGKARPFRKRSLTTFPEAEPQETVMKANSGKPQAFRTARRHAAIAFAFAPAERDVYSYERQRKVHRSVGAKPSVR